MRSCLRRPLAPGISRVRAMRLSSVMFFSLSSAMVMFTCEGRMEVGRTGGGTCSEESGGSVDGGEHHRADSILPVEAVWIGEPERAAPVTGRAACDRDLQNDKA